MKSAQTKVTISAAIPFVSHLQSGHDDVENLHSALELMGKTLPRPLHDRVLVKRIPEAEPEAGAIIAPEIARKKPLEAIVLAVGPGRQREDDWGGSYFQPTQVKAGQKVLISPGVDAGNWSDLAEDALGGMLMITESDVMGVID